MGARRVPETSQVAVICPLKLDSDDGFEAESQTTPRKLLVRVVVGDLSILRRL